MGDEGGRTGLDSGAKHKVPVTEIKEGIHPTSIKAK